MKTGLEFTTEEHCVYIFTVLKRQVSPEELQAPGGPYIKKTFTVSHTHTRTHANIQNVHRLQDLSA